jgi:hypothetical protein
MPEIDDAHKKYDYFFFPYDHNASNEILTEEDFFAKYRFANTQDEDFFVEVDMI